jgi:glucose/mannose-6-phosphate isomerase
VGHRLAGERGTGLIPPERLSVHLEACRPLWGPVVETEANEAKRIALALHGRLPVIYAGVGAPEAALLRWRCNINENAKALCHTAVVPEMDHNEIVGWSGPESWAERATVVVLREGDEDRGTSRRLSATADWLRRHGAPVVEVVSRGATPLERLWWLCHLGDYVSVYLAALYAVDPTPITAISELKASLSEDNP